ncbi:MAG: hypothetical protein AB7U25_10190 [Vicinamibacterales bacterium]
MDLLVGCGGWSLPLLALSYGLAGDSARDWAGAFYALALVANYPHYMATVYRAYGAADRAAHRLYTVYLTAGLVAIGVAAHVDLRLLPVLFTAYVMWSPWHYSGQNYGLSMMFARRAGLAVTPSRAKRLKLAFAASFVMLLAAFNEGASADPMVLSLALPDTATRVVGWSAAAVFLGVGGSALWPMARDAGWRAAPTLLLFLTQGLWFVAPIAVAWATSAPTPQTRYSSGILAVMHSAQYLWITQYFARRDQGAAWRRWAYWAAIVVGGMALFVPVPWLASYLGRVDFTASVLVVTAVVNLHHFMIDGVVWKLRDPRVGRTLSGDATAALVPEPAPTPASSPAARPRWRLVVAGVAAAALVALAGLDQWRYRLALRDADPAALAAAVRVNPYDAVVEARLVRALTARGDEAALRAHFEARLARDPADVDTLVNAGVLARRQGRLAEAERHWTDAVGHDPGLTVVQLYLAELFDEQGRATAAAGRYRRWLERVAAGAPDAPRDAAVVAPVVLKFGDALLRAGHPDEARTQFALAASIARRAGLADLERAARERGQTPFKPGLE